MPHYFIASDFVRTTLQEMELTFIHFQLLVFSVDYYREDK